MNGEDSERQLTPVEAAKKGNPLDRQLLLRHLTPGQLIAGFEGAAIGASINYDSAYIGEHILVLPAYALGGLALAGGSYAALRSIDQRRAKRAEATQAQVREEAGEPVDLYTTGRGRNKEAILRWYGADDPSGRADSDLDLTARFSSLVKYAEANKINALALNAEWVSSQLNVSSPQQTPHTPEDFGSIEDGPRLIANSARSAVTVEDLGSPDDILVTPIEQAARLVSILETNSKELLVGALIKRTGDADLMREFELFKKTEGRSQARLVQHAKGRLEMLINQDSTGVVRNRNEHWEPTRERVHSTRQINGEYIQETIQTDAQSGRPSASFEITSLLASYNVKTLEGLTKKVLMSPSSEASNEEAIAAIYLLALKNSKTQREMLNTVPKRAQSATSDSTFFEELVEQPRTFSDTIRNRAIEKDPDIASVRYEKRRGLRRAVITAGTFAIAASALFGARYLANDNYGNLYVERSDWCDEAEILSTNEEYQMNNDQIGTSTDWSKFYAACQESYIESNQLNGTVLDTLDDTFNAEWQLQKSTARIILDMGGSSLLSRFAPDIAGIVSNEWKNNISQELPPSVFTGNINESFTGDVLGEGNKALYKLTSLDGTSTEGYWYTNSFNRINARQGMIGFDNSSMNEERSVDSIPGQDLTQEELNAFSSLVVTTPYVSFNSNLSLPVLEGMAIRGMKIVDKNNPENEYTPQKYIENITELSSESLSLSGEYEALRRAGINNPVLKYWLSPVEAIDSHNHFSQPLVFPYAYSQDAHVLSDAEVKQAALKELSSEVKESLELDSNASTDTVLEAIQSKKYSFTPLKDAGLEGFETTTASEYESFAEIGMQISQLDALNCNLASAAFLLATADSSAQYNQVVGFREDGDGVLSQKEAHAWVIDANNSIIDPTPNGYGTNSPEVTDFPEDTGSNGVDYGTAFRDGSIVVGAGIGALIAWRNRRKLLEKLSEHRAHSILNHADTPKAVSIIEQAYYDDPEHTVDWKKVANSTDARLEERISQIATSGSGLRINPTLKQALQNPTLTAEEKRAVKRVYRSAQTVTPQA